MKSTVSILTEMTFVTTSAVPELEIVHGGESVDEGTNEKLHCAFLNNILNNSL